MQMLLVVKQYAFQSINIWRFIPVFLGVHHPLYMSTVVSATRLASPLGELEMHLKNRKYLADCGNNIQIVPRLNKPVFYPYIY